MTEFEAGLPECLEALSEGRWDLDECLRRNPEHAASLRPLLLAATMTARAYDVRPREEFATAARERFLVATGQRLQEAMDVEPSPAFFAAARIRFLMAAQLLKMGRAAAQRQPYRVPMFGSPFRALASGMAALVIFLGFSTYTLASASAALPGDWQYPIKLQTERVRVALAFSDEAKRDVKLDIAEERVSELQQLTKRGKIIGPGVLDRLVEQTQPLIDDAKDGGWLPEEAARLELVSEKQQEVLQQASARIAPDAQDRLADVADVSKSAQEVSKLILFFADPARPPAVLTPSVPLALTLAPAPTQTPETTPPAQPADASSSAPGPSGAAASETPAGAVAPKDIVIDSTPAETRNGVKLYAATVGQVTFLAPGSSDGWKLVDAPETGVPALIKFANRDDTSLMIISTATGDMYWYIGQNGHFDEVQMRITRDGRVFVADRAVLRTAYGDASDIPWYVLQSIIRIAPTPTVTAAATATPVPSNTAAAGTAAAKP